MRICPTRMRKEEEGGGITEESHTLISHVMKPPAAAWVGRRHHYHVASSWAVSTTLVTCNFGFATPHVYTYDTPAPTPDVLANVETTVQQAHGPAAAPLAPRSSLAAQVSPNLRTWIHRPGRVGREGPGTGRPRAFPVCSREGLRRDGENGKKVHARVER